MTTLLDTATLENHHQWPRGDLSFTTSRITYNVDFLNGGLALWQQEGHAQEPSAFLTLALFVHSGPGENAIMLLTFPSFHPFFPPSFLPSSSWGYWFTAEEEAGPRLRGVNTGLFCLELWAQEHPEGPGRCLSSIVDKGERKTVAGEGGKSEQKGPPALLLPFTSVLN